MVNSMTDGPLPDILLKRHIIAGSFIQWIFAGTVLLANAFYADGCFGEWEFGLRVIKDLQL